jgi:hypothetical protein
MRLVLRENLAEDRVMVWQMAAPTQPEVIYSDCGTQNINIKQIIPDLLN